MTLVGRKKSSLTANEIKKLGVYYSRAICKYNTTEEMQKAIKALYFHCMFSDDNPMHQFCEPHGVTATEASSPLDRHRLWQGAASKEEETIKEYGDAGYDAGAY